MIDDDKIREGMAHLHKRVAQTMVEEIAEELRGLANNRPEEARQVLQQLRRHIAAWKRPR